MAIAKGFRRYSVDVPQEHKERLDRAYLDDGIGQSPRTRILIDLWVHDRALQKRVRARGKELREERLGERQERAGG